VAEFCVSMEALGVVTVFDMRWCGKVFASSAVDFVFFAGGGRRNFLAGDIR
jgi:hypothetical protein